MLTGYFKYIILMLVLLGSSVSLHANRLEDGLRKELAAAKTVEDSLVLMFNIYDVKSYKERSEALETIYTVAKRVQNEKALLDVLFLMAACHESNDSMQKIIMQRVNDMPESDAQKSIRLYIKLRNASITVPKLSDAERQDRILDLLYRYKDTSKLDIYGRIEYLFYLCTYLRNTAKGEMLIKYIRELRDEIDKLPARDLELRSLFYKQASKSFLSNGLYEEAAQANKMTLEITDEYDRKHASEGRRHRNYTGTTYMAYQNLLLCHSVLPQAEIDTYYRRMLKLENTVERLHDNVKFRHLSKIYYLIAKKQYAEAIPLIREQLDSDDNDTEEYNRLVTALIEASRAVADNDDLLYALNIYTDLLQKRIEDKADASFKELQILYDVNNLKQKNNELINNNRQKDALRHKAFVTYTIIVFIIIMVLLGFVFSLYRRSKHFANKLNHSNKQLVNERDALKEAQKDLIKARDKAKAADRIKTDFVNNMSHEIRTPLSAIVEYSSLISDCAEEDKREYIKRFADIISLNTDLLMTLVNDVLELQNLEKANFNICITPSSINEICTLSSESIRKRLAPGVELVFAKKDSPDVTILTDRHRVEQVLLNLMSNAAKFTSEGTITLDYTFSDDRSKVTFSVTDTGIGIPRGKEEIIFSRFEKINSDTQGNGLGLYISRLLAGLLKGEIKLDTAYRRGARFLFTIPVV